MSGVISHGADWDFDLLERYDSAIGEIAREFRLDTYANQIEIITSEQMLDAYASNGLPVGYPHWSYGKEFIRNEQAYRRGMQGLAYEIVINSSPCIAYLMEENTMATQALVMAHACYGHNSFFKGNHLFRQWTDAESILADRRGDTLGTHYLATKKSYKDFHIRAEFWVSDESPDHRNYSPASLGGGTVRLILTVADPVAVVARAVAAGAREIRPVTDEDYGWRMGRVLDPYGHDWEVGHPLPAEDDR
jgi:hypothetical protein